MSGPQPTSLGTYLRANLLFGAFLLLAALIGYFACGALWDEATKGVMRFLLWVMGGGFALISVLDFIYERNSGRSSAKGEE